MSDLSCQQNEIVELPLGAICVMACAGSGKTRTAVHRLWQMRRQLKDRHGIIALLSFSNVAIDTFRKDYFALAEEGAYSLQSSGVEIDTVDSFITRNILRPHAHRTMGASRTAYLVHGREPFLSNYSVYDGKLPQRIADLNVHAKNGTFSYDVTPGYKPIPIVANIAEAAIGKLGMTGAYTHSLGRYWSIKVLQQQPFVLRSLARRYPHILVDEAQDIGTEHQALFEMLIKTGVHVSLIGDKNQGIYEFTGATGDFLATYGDRLGVVSKRLTKNYRSVPDIVTLANNLTGRSDCAARSVPAHLNGAFYVTYKDDERDKLLALFQSLIDQAKVATDKAVVLCRSSEWVEKWRGDSGSQGQGTVRVFADACVYRDLHSNYHEAFKRVCAAVVALLDSDHGNLTSLMALSSTQPKMRRAKRLVWGFMRDAKGGLPSSALAADTDWHPSLLKNVSVLLDKLAAECDLKKGKNIGQKLAKKLLTSKPIAAAEVGSSSNPRFKFSTVHQVKGESIEAVLYVASKANIRELLDGTATEVGRIGYVAVTRACSLFVLAIPENCSPEFDAELLSKGFRKAGA